MHDHLAYVRTLTQPSEIGGRVNPWLNLRETDVRLIGFISFDHLVSCFAMLFGYLKRRDTITKGHLHNLSMRGVRSPQQLLSHGVGPTTSKPKT